MNLTPTIPVTKRTRAKVPGIASEPPQKSTLTIRKPRARKKSASVTLESAAVQQQVEVVGRTDGDVTAMIATVAYYRAAERNFLPGGEIDDWLAAERQVLATLK